MVPDGGKSGWESLVERDGQGGQAGWGDGGIHMESVERPGMKAFLCRFLQRVSMGKGERRYVWGGRVRTVNLRSKVTRGRRCLRWRGIWSHWG